jgi:hypothetical protein
MSTGRPRTFDVSRGVSDHQRVSHREGMTRVLCCTAHGQAWELGAVGVIATKGPDGKVVGEPSGS